MRRIIEGLVQNVLFHEFEAAALTDSVEFFGEAFVAQDG